jgi:hypothetical protein
LLVLLAGAVLSVLGSRRRRRRDDARHEEADEEDGAPDAVLADPSPSRPA